MHSELQKSINSQLENFETKIQEILSVHEAKASELERREKNLHSEIEVWERQKERLSQSSAKGDEVVTLNLRGSKVQITRKVLTRDSQSDLAALFSGKVELNTMDDGSIFLDRNPEVFTLLLDYLSNDF